jgi:hypothetical protein
MWRQIDEYGGMYEVSNTGKVRSIINDQVKLLVPYIINGYLYVHLKNKNKSVHRLVARAFIPNPNNLECVNHKDYNRQNNDIENLEWCTRTYNVLYSRDRFKRPHKAKVGVSGEKYISCTPNGKYRVQIRSVTGINYNKTFIEIEQAISARDRVLTENNYV